MPNQSVFDRLVVNCAEVNVITANGYHIPCIIKAVNLKCVTPYMTVLAKKTGTTQHILINSISTVEEVPATSES